MDAGPPVLPYLFIRPPKAVTLRPRSAHSAGFRAELASAVTPWGHIHWFAKSAQPVVS
jgi:hypothetical protein